MRVPVIAPFSYRYRALQCGRTPGMSGLSRATCSACKSLTPTGFEAQVRQIAALERFLSEANHEGQDDSEANHEGQDDSEANHEGQDDDVLCCSWLCRGPDPSPRERPVG